MQNRLNDAELNCFVTDAIFLIAVGNVHIIIQIQ